MLMATHAEGRSSISAAETLRPLLDVVPVRAEAKRRLCGLMSQSHRHYHGAEHLALLWERHRFYAADGGLDRPDIDRLVGSAIAYHDAIYETGRCDNESRSAELWLEASRNASISETERSWVAETIRATADHLGYAPGIEMADDSLPITERARLWMLDLDLTPLGEEPATFDANSRRLRAESARTPDAAFETARRGLLRRLDASPRIYRSPVLASAFEPQARRNIARELGGDG